LIPRGYGLKTRIKDESDPYIKEIITTGERII
jgi:hypothetical protein